MDFADQMREQSLAGLQTMRAAPLPDEAAPPPRVRGFSSAIWPRIFGIFLALCLIKVLMLVGFREQLFEIHWRVIPQPPVSWINELAFYGFAALVGLNLWRLAERCKVAGARVVRRANACVLVISAAFIFLTFHEGDKNYLYPVLKGILRWSDLSSYLSLNFFFRPPFLAAWLLGYALIYYGFARSRREHLMLYVTAVCATVYTTLFLAEFKQYFDAIIIVDLFGIAGLFSGWRTKRPLGAAWICLPLAWVAFMFLLFCGLAPQLTLGRVYPEFAVLFGASVGLFVLAGVVANRGGFFGGWSWVTPFAFVTFLLLVNVNYPPAPNYENLLCDGLTLPRYFLGEFGLSLILLAAATGYRRWRPGGSLLWVDGIGFVLVAWALADLRLSQVMGVRLDWSALSLALGETPKMMWRMSRHYLPAVLGALACLVGLYVVLLSLGRRVSSGTDFSPVRFESNGRDAHAVGAAFSGATVEPTSPGRPLVPPAGARAGTPRRGVPTRFMEWVACRRMSRQQSAGARRETFRGFLTPGLRFFLVTFVLLGLAGECLIERDKAEGQSALLLAETSPLWTRAENPPMSKQNFIKTAEALGMPQLATPQKAVVTGNPPRNLNVVLIFQESTYNRFLSLFDGTHDTQPLLSRYKDRMEIFPNFFSDFAGSMNSRFATFNGIYPVRDFKSFTEQRVNAKSLFEILHDHGYNCSLFYSSFLDYTDFRDYLRGRGLDEVYDADTMPGPRKLKPVSWGLREEETLGVMQAQIKKYAAQKQKFFLTYVPAAPHNPFDGTPKRFLKFHREKMGDYTPSYLNELLYMDWVISSVVDQLKESGLLDRTLIVITDDHGEMLGENGGPIGHGWALTPRLANIPLIIMDPGRRGYRVNDTIGSQVDLLPTMLSILQIPAPQNQLYQGTSLYSAEGETNRIIYLNTMQQYALVKGRQMFFGDRETAGDSGWRNLDKIYTITNNGARTGFVQEEPSAAPTLPSIAAFDQFQENFLRNYSHYCQMMRPQAASPK